jgi:hypothetical protein
MADPVMTMPSLRSSSESDDFRRALDARVIPGGRMDDMIDATMPENSNADHSGFISAAEQSRCARLIDGVAVQWPGGFSW